MTTVIDIQGLSKVFTLHNQGGARLTVLQEINLRVAAGECLVLHGQSGSGKSTLLRTLYANYLPSDGRIRLRHRGEMVDLASAGSHLLLEIRRETLGYVSQFLRVIPRVSALEVVKQPLRERGVDDGEAEARARALLERLNIPQRLWSLAPGTFSGGEQQRINIARGFIADHPLLLLDEPTASLDRDNCQVVVALIREALVRGSAVVGIFHDAAVREAVASRVFDMGRVDSPVAASCQQGVGS
ncbi:phosphonate C-P lyase system protein PhnL [Sedimenticola thiotaurini]|uniref:ABC transporter domain-containing protein n=1 Tax=Sedimenticola thiotaurini TaxID=1543721 RepID=A0A0F7K2W0_9GAMM|nr:phosphonate C-P lyase system protein PhnL [Sedimenticola thiotaurini]AKH21909.1 hypothetical protein AAY24_17915 [Sedimenticola thiotaurini]